MLLLQNIIDSKYYYQPSWLLIIILFSLMILGYLYAAFKNRFSTFIKSAITGRFPRQSSKEDRSLSHTFSLLLSLNFILTASLFILQLISSSLKNGVHLSWLTKVFSPLEIDFSFLSFLIISVIIFVIYFIKILFMKIVGFIIDKQEIISEYTFTIFLMNKFLGVILLPVVIFIAYGSPHFINIFIYLGFALLVAVFIARVGKGITTVLMNRESTLFYIILYLCTLEVLPLLLGWKLFEKLVR